MVAQSDSKPDSSLEPPPLEARTLRDLARANVHDREGADFALRPTVPPDELPSTSGVRPKTDFHLPVLAARCRFWELPMAENPAVDSVGRPGQDSPR